MTEPKPANGHALRARIAEEMADGMDEELEMEIDDERLDQLLTDISVCIELSSDVSRVGRRRLLVDGAVQIVEHEADVSVDVPVDAGGAAL